MVCTPELPRRINEIVVPRKLTVCQYMVASGEMQCYRKGCFPPTMGPDESVGALVPNLMAVDESIATEVGPGGSPGVFTLTLTLTVTLTLTLTLTRSGPGGRWSGSCLP